MQLYFHFVPFSLAALKRDCVCQFNQKSSRMRSFFFLGLTISLTLLSPTDLSPPLLSLPHTQSLSLLSSPLQTITLTPVLSLPPNLSCTVPSPMIRLRCCSGLSRQWASFLPPFSTRLASLPFEFRFLSGIAHEPTSSPVSSSSSSVSFKNSI